MGHFFLLPLVVNNVSDPHGDGVPCAHVQSRGMRKREKVKVSGKLSTGAANSYFVLERVECIMPRREKMCAEKFLPGVVLNNILTCVVRQRFRF